MILLFVSLIKNLNDQILNQKILNIASKKWDRTKNIMKICFCHYFTKNTEFPCAVEWISFLFVNSFTVTPFVFFLLRNVRCLGSSFQGNSKKFNKIKNISNSQFFSLFFLWFIKKEFVVLSIIIINIIKIDQN